MIEAPSAVADDRVLLAAGWSLWPWIFLRSTGFPSRRILALGDQPVAAAVDRLLGAEEASEDRRREALAAVGERLDRVPPEQRSYLLDLLRKLRKGRLPARWDAGDLALHAFAEARERVDHEARVCRRELEAAQGRLAGRLRDLVRDERFREALAWQNRNALETGLDVYLRWTEDGYERSGRVRQKELLLVSYLLRYHAKNDTIGFFGPRGWGRFTTEAEVPPVAVRCGDALLARRRVFLELWGVDALARRLGEEPGVRPWLAPRRLPFCHLEGDLCLCPAAPPRRLAPEELAVLACCDGERRAIDVARRSIAEHGLASEKEVYEVLERLAGWRLLAWEPHVAAVVEPERALRRQLEGIGEPALARRLLASLDRLEAARDALAAAAGDAPRVERAMASLDACFTGLTGQPPTRAEGRYYGGRTLVYEECRRDVEIEVGPELLARLGPPLALVLTSARWLTHRVAEGYRAAFRRSFEELRSLLGRPRVDLIVLLARVLRGEGADLLSAQCLPELQRRWQEVLALPPDGRSPVRYAAAELAPRVEAAFAAPGPGWATACHHGVDLLIAAPGPAALRSGDYQLVLGEVHPSCHLMYSILVEQHPWRDGVLAAFDRDLPRPRVLLLPAQRGDGDRAVNPLGVPTLPGRFDLGPIRPEDRVVLLTAEPPAPGWTTVAVGDLVVAEEAGEPVVLSRDGAHRFDAVEFCATALMSLTGARFRLVEPRPHVPRISIDRLVVQRESWSLPVAGTQLAAARTDAERFVEARRLARCYGLPRFVFVKSPLEVKPIYLDFDSPFCAELLAKLARDLERRGDEGAEVVVSEMLPGFDDLWLPDSRGRTYASELRLVAVDHGDGPG